MKKTGKLFTSVALSLRGRLVVLICLATLPAMLFTVYIAHRERSVALARTRDEADHILNILSREHLYQISGARGLLKWLTDKLSSEGEGTIVRDSSFLAALLSGYPQLGNIAILAANGDVINSAYPLPGAVNMLNYHAIQKALHSRDIETGVYVIGPIVKRPLLHLAQSVRDKNGVVRWIVFVALDLEWLKRLIEQINLPEDEILLVVDSNGRVLANSSPADSTLYPLGMRISELASGSTPANGFVNIKAGKVSRSFITRAMKDVPGLLTATAVPYDRIYARANETFYRMLGSLLLLILCTAISVIFLEEVALLRYLRSLSTAARRFGEGDFSVRVSVPKGYGELQNMARVFNTMAETLTSRHRELAEAHARLDKLARHLQIAREAEAQRIARDLHDEVGQILTSIKLDLASFQRRCSQVAASPPIDALIEENVATVREKIDALVEFIRRIASDLRPPVLDRMGLVSAIELLARNLEQKSELVIEVEAEPTDEPKDWLISTEIYRIVQETLTNIARHASASEALIKLEKTDSEYLLVIKDNGKGMEPGASEKESLGIIGMRERARLVDGSFALASEPGKGTVITVTIPLKDSEGDNANIAG